MLSVDLEYDKRISNGMADVYLHEFGLSGAQSDVRASKDVKG